MCIVSNVGDWHRSPGLPWPEPMKPYEPPKWAPYWQWTEEAWYEFQRLKEIARKLDKEQNLPDCEDPEKAKFEKQVEEYLKKKGILK